MLTTLVIVSVLTSFTIFTIVNTNHNSSHIIQKVLDRLDEIENGTLQDQKYNHEVQHVLLMEIYQMLNKTQ